MSLRLLLSLFLGFSPIAMSCLSVGPLYGEGELADLGMRNLSEMRISRSAGVVGGMEDTHRRAVEDLMRRLGVDKSIKIPVIYYVLKSVNADLGIVEFEDGSSWKIASWCRLPLRMWRSGDRLAIYYHRERSTHTRIENLDFESEVWGVEANVTGGGKAIVEITRDGEGVKVCLKNGWSFTHSSKDLIERGEWKMGDPIHVFHKEDSDRFDLWNLDKGQVIYNWELLSKGLSQVGGQGKESPESFHGIDLDIALELEDRLNERVISQREATKAVAQSILNYCAGLKDEKTPLGVFLFLGPTGVGKTELAKILADELYPESNSLIRFDMSYFSEPHTIARLIGSPPGYVNHEEGGQLTEAIKAAPRSIVLLDEIEKANSAIHKLFLPVFDEGYITDSRDENILCNQTLFIMTSNLCSKEIQKLYNNGCSAEEILSVVEPSIIDKLSPEVYNRVEPIIFQPLDQAAMELLVDRMLGDLIRKLKENRDIDLVLGEGVKAYLIDRGYHPTLGARPLKKLIQRSLIAALSKAIVGERIPDGSRIDLNYEEESESWSVDWSK